jgi:hypothetical protein
MQAFQEDFKGGIDEYCPFIFPDGNGLVAVLTGYFDESERREHNEPFCVAGVVFTPAQYKRFRRYWQSNVLRYRGRRFSAFHMADLVGGHEEYKGLKISDRLTILDHAIHAIASNVSAGVAVHFAQAEFEQKAPAGWSDLFGSIYTAACGMCMQTTGYWLTQWGYQMDVLYVLEKGHKFRAQADEYLTMFGQEERFRRRCRYRNHIFELKREPGLQAADLCAWVVTKAMVTAGGHVSNSTRPFVMPMVDLVHRLGDRFKLYPFEGERLDEFFADVMKQPLNLFVRKGEYPKGLR